MLIKNLMMMMMTLKVAKRHCSSRIQTGSSDSNGLWSINYLTTGVLTGALEPKNLYFDWPDSATYL